MRALHPLAGFELCCVANLSGAVSPALRLLVASVFLPFVTGLLHTSLDHLGIQQELPAFRARILISTNLGLELTGVEPAR